MKQSASSKPTTSLELLNPEPWVPNSQPATTTTSTTTTAAHDHTAIVLEQLSKGLIEAFCANDFSSPLLQYVNPHFQAYIDYSSATVRSLEEHIAYHVWMHSSFPGYVYEVQNVSADVDEEKGLASTWNTLRVTGHPQKIQRESITVFWWRRKQGIWRVYKQFGVRGVGWFAEGKEGYVQHIETVSQPPPVMPVRDRLDVDETLPDLYHMPVRRNSE